MRYDQRYRRPWYELEQRSQFNYGRYFFGVYTNVLGIAIFFGLWAIFSGWISSLMITGAVLIHEIGHAVACRRRGIQVELDARAPIGMAIVPLSACRTKTDQIDVSLYGPLFGLGTALVGLGLWHLTGSGYAAQFTMMACWLNAFNLIPVGMLDGGQATKELTTATNSPRFGMALQTFGMFLLVLLFGYTLTVAGPASVIIMGIILFSVGRSYYHEYLDYKSRAWPTKKSAAHLRLVGSNYKPRWTLPVSVVVTRTLAYLGLIAAFAAIYFFLM